jgi:hypothetical protein
MVTRSHPAVFKAARYSTRSAGGMRCNLGLPPRGGHWNAGVSMPRINDNDFVRTSTAGFELGQALSGFQS